MIVTFEGHTPELSPECFVAENAAVVGKVAIGKNSSVWFGAVIRGDEDSITVGEDTSIQDNAVLHCDQGHPVTIGNGVTIGHGAVVHGCTIGDNALIGMGAVAVGVPAKVVKTNEDYNRSMNSLNAAVYVQLGAEYRRAAQK